MESSEKQRTSPSSDRFGTALGASIPLEEIIITAELGRRRSRAPDYEAENHALVEMIRSLEQTAPGLPNLSEEFALRGARHVWQRLVEITMQLCNVHSCGVSILEGAPGRESFRWQAAAGVWSKFSGQSIPRDASPCGIVLQENRALLVCRPERHFNYPMRESPPIVEALLVPLHQGLTPIGTLWIISHDETRQFDAEDRRLLTRMGWIGGLAAQIEQRALELRHSDDRLRNMASELARSGIHERKRLARVLHDNVQQYLVAAKFRAATLRASTEGDRKQDLTAISEALDAAINAARGLSQELAPPILQAQGIGPALQWLGLRFHDQHGLAVEVTCNAEVDDETIRDTIFQIVRELLLNIVKHAQTRHAWVTLVRQEDQWELVVRDCGRGFNPDEHHNRGNSMGLLHIREHLQSLGGRMSIAGQVGEGVQVNVEIPARHAKTAEPSADSAIETPRTTKIRVLVVDDHQIVREGLISLLSQQSDIQVLGEAANGLEAVELAWQFRPDVVVMDINMPRMDGIDATRLISRGLPRVQVIGLSLHSEPDLSKMMLRAGAATYLAKDGPTADLIRAIRTVANSPLLSRKVPSGSENDASLHNQASHD